MFVEVSTPHPYKANLQRSVADKTEPMAVQKKKCWAHNPRKNIFFKILQENVIKNGNGCGIPYYVNFGRTKKLCRS